MGQKWQHRKNRYNHVKAAGKPLFSGPRWQERIMISIKTKRIFLYLDGILILLACPFMLKGFILSTDWTDKLLWGLGILFGIPCGVLCVKTARKGSNDAVEKALKDLSSD